MPDNPSLLVHLLRFYELRNHPEKAMVYSGRWLRTNSGNKLLRAILRFERITLFFRQGRMRRVHHEVERALWQDSQTPWFGELSKLLAGQTGPEPLLSKYPDFNRDAIEYILISYVLNKRWKPLEQLLTKEKAFIQGSSRSDPLFAQLVRNVQKALDKTTGGGDVVPPLERF
jgi:hypothetical protein